MKQIKKIVLKDATTLTNAQMKLIRGGYEPERSAVCSVQCTIGVAELDCSSAGHPGAYCDVYSGVGGYGVACYYGNTDVGPSEYCKDPEIR